MRIKMGLMALAFTAMGYGCDDGDTGGNGQLGAACSTGGDCASGLCFPGENYCTEECSAAAPCPSGYECFAANVNVCVPESAGEGGAGGMSMGGAGGDGAGGDGGEGGNGAGGDGGNGAGGDGGNGAGGDGGNGAGGAGGGMPPAGLDCPGIIQCFNGCGQDRACGDNCIESGSEEGRELFLAYFECLQANGGDQDACQEQATACVGAPPSGDGECPDFYSCAGQCPDGEAGQDCVRECFGGLNGEAQNQVLDIVNCIQALRAENPNATDEDIQNACSAEIQACFPPGDGECRDFYSCAGQCPAGEAGAACQQDCFNDLTADAQSQVSDISNCVTAAREANPNITDAEVEEACAAEIEVCFPPVPPGDDACGAVLECALMAGQDADAAQACFEGGTEAARDLFTALVGCMNDNECQQPDCPACADQQAACEADGGMMGEGGMGGEGGGMMGEGGMGGDPVDPPEGGAGGMGGDPVDPPEGGAGGMGGAPE